MLKVFETFQDAVNCVAGLNGGNVDKVEIYASTRGCVTYAPIEAENDPVWVVEVDFFIARIVRSLGSEFGVHFED